MHQGKVKIGDLGLATYFDKATYTTTTTSSHNINNSLMQQPENSTSVSANNTTVGINQATNSFSSQVGTFLYAAPECNTGRYDEKCDIFSLGVVLVEMFSNFATGMERAEVLQNLQSAAIDSNWACSHPIQAQLAESMLSLCPTLRPSCSQILGILLEQNLWKQPSPAVLEHLVSDLQAQVAKLQVKANDKDQVITKLRKLLDEHNIPHGHIQ